MTDASALPEFDEAPLVEVALGVQFEPIPAIRPMELGPLRDRWREDYPLVQETIPLPPQIESDAPGLPAVQFMVGSVPPPRLWFLTERQTELIQLQHDRLIVNWRQTAQDVEYPRYAAVRDLFAARLDDLSAFLAERDLGAIEITQVEVTYINAIEPNADGRFDLDRVLRHWHPLAEHHLGQSEQARAALVFAVPELGRAPVRMYVAVDPGVRPNGKPALFLTLTVRGAPADGSREAALAFMNEAHVHADRSFVELTTPRIHEEWRRSS